MTTKRVRTISLCDKGGVLVAAATTTRRRRPAYMPRQRRARVRCPGAVRRPATGVLAPAPKIAMLIPAHNEERLIAKTIDSVLSQSLCPDRIIVIADNCTDATAAIARAKGVEVLETVDNTAKKAGALNQGYRLVREAEVVIQVDADIVFDRHFVRELVSTLRAEKTAGAVTARVGVQGFPGAAPSPGRCGRCSAWSTTTTTR